MSCEQYTELKNILSKKRTHDRTLEEPVEKKTCTFQSSSFLTPPSTPKSSENMEEIPKNDTDMLQSLINIKNETQPVSLNTVQVSWMENVPPNEQLYQDVLVPHLYASSRSSQHYETCSPPQESDLCFYEHLQNSSAPQHCNTEYNLQDCSQIQSYPTAIFPNQDLQNCSLQSLMSLLVDPDDSSEIMSSVKSASPAQNYSQSPSSSSSNFGEPGMTQKSLQVSPPLFVPDRNSLNPLQMGKSFFQWQIEQEEGKVGNLSNEQLLCKDSDGDTCLHISVAQGRRALSYVLARKMAALNLLDIKERNNQSSLQVAVAANQHLIVQDLLSLGAQLSTIDYWGRTPLHVCAEKGYFQVMQAIQKEATERNQIIDVEAKNYDGLTALHCAVMAHNAVVQELQKSLQNRTTETEQLLLKNKAMVDTVKILLQMGACVEAKDSKSGRTALHMAAEEANLELLGLFLELTKSLSFINEKAYNGNTALHVAASLQYRKTHLGAVRLLMRKGADPSARNLENEQPVHLVPDGPVGEEIRRVLKGKSVQQRMFHF
ncbi:hypothetical protein GDO86_003975 [Hymenochirus boettgeri]|nr:hypothetical protein GDO86_003975 [Hymenochirus boettgeri]KAG8451994.1 hypothetical protein GDO86_003975 [Hymenochirus boettgeri]